MNSTLNKQEVMDALREVLDPEVPVLNIVELGIVRDILMEKAKTTIVITPTYSGCPAMKVIEDDIRSKMKEKGISDLSIKTILSPAWTTDWMQESAKLKLKDYGIAPPEGSPDKRFLFAEQKTIHCPFCSSTNTVLKSQFGSTACKALYYCNDCREPFDYFKCI
jgi:ring-1,2-phenylacetyl-CoA epoxidase subunit PaaD